MTRIGMMLAAAGVGTLLLGAGEAWACKGHVGADTKAAEAKLDHDAEGRQAQASAPAGSDPVVAAKCQCSSAADCTCKKGTCQCSKCKKPKKRQVVEPLKGQTRTPWLEKARYDASTGVFI